MEKFIKKMVAFVLIIFICCSGISLFNVLVVGSQYKYSYQASLVDKVNRLESISEPKIILVGNSNVAFGIDSKKIEEAFGMPVVNLGLHGGLGNAFHEEIAKLNIGEGDIVVVCHSSFDDTDEIVDKALAWITIDNHKEIGKIIRKKDYPLMLTAYPNYLRNSTITWWVKGGNTDGGDCYSRNAFNEYGDVIYKPVGGQINVDVMFAETAVHVPKINDVCVERLNKYNKYITDRGASLVVAGYPIAYGKYTTFDKKDFVDFRLELQADLDCEVISDYTDYFYPYEYFYNTTLHLTTEGAETRTEQLISDLREWRHL